MLARAFGVVLTATMLGLLWIGITTGEPLLNGARNHPGLSQLPGWVESYEYYQTFCVVMWSIISGSGVLLLNGKKLGWLLLCVVSAVWLLVAASCWLFGSYSHWHLSMFSVGLLMSGLVLSVLALQRFRSAP